ncbi:hypothetical protein NZK33_15975 [Cyanobium sp. FGCU-6]|nr:hypothetical protein [Cyanobium sp. FGCU6]
MGTRADGSRANLHQAASAAAPPAQREPSATNQARVGAGFRGSGADLLGGPLSLADLVEAPLWPSARPTRPDPWPQAQTADPLATRWNDHLRALVKHTPLVLPVEVVRLRCGAGDRAQVIPMALWPDGSATTNVETPSPGSRQLAHDWVRSQPPPAEGSVRPVVMVIEPAVARTAVPGPGPGP